VEFRILLRPWPHEFDPASGDNVGLESIGTQIAQKFHHRLVDALGVGTLELGMSGCGQPVSDDCLKLLLGHTRVRCGHELHEALLSSRRNGFHIGLKNSFELLRRLPVWMFRSKLLDTVEDEGQLHIHRLFDPKSAIIVEGGDTLVDGNKIGRTLFRHFFDERDDGFLGSSVVPGW